MMAQSKQLLAGLLFILLANLISFSQSHVLRQHEDEDPVAGRLHWRAVNSTNTTLSLGPGTTGGSGLGLGTGTGVVILPTSSTTSTKPASSNSTSSSKTSSAGGSSSSSSRSLSTTSGASNSTATTRTSTGTSTVSGSSSTSSSGSSTRISSGASNTTSPSVGPPSSTSVGQTASSPGSNSTTAGQASSSGVPSTVVSTPRNSSGTSSSSSSGSTNPASSVTGSSRPGSSSSGATATTSPTTRSSISSGIASAPATTTTSNAGGGVVIIITTGSSTVTTTATGTEVKSSATEVSSDYDPIFTIIPVWLKTPDPPRATEITNLIDGVIPKAKSFLDKFPKPEGELDPCGSSKKRALELPAHTLSKRAFLDGLFKSVFNLVTCIIDNTNKLKSNIQGSHTDVVENILKDLKPQVDALNKLDPDDKPDNSQSPSQSSSKPTSSTTSSSTCTATKTASACRVQCIATATTTLGAVRGRAEQSCSTVCEAVTGCSATGTTSSSASTTTITEVQLCSPECEACRNTQRAVPTDAKLDRFPTTSGKGYVPASTVSVQKFDDLDANLDAKRAARAWTPARETSPAVPKERLEERGLKQRPKKRSVFGPEHFNNDVSLFLRTILAAWSILVPHGVAPALSTANTVQLLALPDYQGVVNLYGCTSVIVVSRKRIWLSHFWEGPSFNNPGGPDQFQADVINTMLNGGQGIAQGITAFTGPGGDFENIRANKVRAFIVTPYVRGVLNPDANTPLLYNARVDRIKDELRTALGHQRQGSVGQRDPLVIPYVPLGPQANPLGPFDFAFGKVLVQYSPFQRFEVNANGCMRQVARLEIWVEDHPTFRYRDEWTADANQVLPPLPAPGGNGRRGLEYLEPRQGGSCPLQPSKSSTSSGTSSQVSTSKSGAATGTQSTATTLSTATSSRNSNSALPTTATSPKPTATSSVSLTTTKTSPSPSLTKTSTTSTNAAPSPSASSTCKSGQYKDWDECSAKCSEPGATCTESAGVAGVRCDCPVFVKYDCEPYIGDRTGEQCICTPNNCEVGKEDWCIVQLAKKNSGGCDGDCKGCNV